MIEGEGGLLEWLGTFDGVTTEGASIGTLADGVALADALACIAPDYFSTQGITREVNGNWALGRSNLKSVVTGLEGFYHEVLGKDAQFSSADLTAAAKGTGEEDLMKVARLLVGAAISCEDKSKHVQAIMGMSLEGQAAMQQVIQQTMAGVTDFDGPGMRGGEGVQELEILVDSLREDNAALQIQLEEEAQERSGLEKEKAALLEKLHEAEVASDMKNAQDHSEVTARMLAEVRESLEEKESECEELRGKVEVSESQLEAEASLRSKLQVEMRQIADELDLSQAKAASLTKAEATVEKYKKRIEEMSGIADRLKEVEDQNASYLDQILELESEKKTIPLLKAKIEQYKDEKLEMERARFQAESAVAVKEAEVERLEAELSEVQKTRVLLEEEIEGHKVDASEQDAVEGGGLGVFESSTGFRERVARLQQENELLKAKLSGSGAAGSDSTTVALLESQLEDAQRAKEERSQDAIAAKRRVNVLESEVARLAPLAEGGGKTKEMELVQEHLMEQLKKCEGEKNEVTAKLDKLENYAKKMVIKYTEVIDKVKREVEDRDERYKHLQEQMKETKVAHKREEKLLVSSLYELGMVRARQLSLSVSLLRTNTHLQDYDIALSPNAVCPLSTLVLFSQPILFSLFQQVIEKKLQHTVEPSRAVLAPSNAGGTKDEGSWMSKQR
ncbi:unnamed protein product, partial [Chrysoparadoxa australica]